MRIQQVRARYQLDKRRLMRARRLYARLTYRAFCRCPDEQMNTWLNAIAIAGCRRGLWSMSTQTRMQKEQGVPGNLSHIRYSLLRKWWAIEHPNKDWRTWHEWYAERGFREYRFDFCGKLKVAV